jgi:hypothetical protein
MKVSSRSFVAVVALLLATWIVRLEMATRTRPSIPPADDPPAPAWDRSGWDRVRIGMPAHEVVRLLGPPPLKVPHRRIGGEMGDQRWAIIEAFALIVLPMWIGGMDGFCSFHCERWEYDGGPGVTRWRFLQFGPSPESFVVYFTDEKVVWLRRPTVGPLVEGE